MDAVVIRGVWRGFAASVNKLIYNDVATEARFSPQVAPIPNMGNVARVTLSQ